MADSDQIESIRISELAQASSVDSSNDFLVISRESSQYTSGYESFKVTPSQLVSGTVPAAVDVDYDNTTSGLSATDVQAAIDEVVNDIANLPEPMVFKGSLGEGGTISSLPVDGSANVGDTYKVITDGTYAGLVAKAGDTVVCDSKTVSANTWTLIPSGDEAGGTVTSITIQATSPIVVDNSSAITTSGTRTLSHAASGVTAGSYGDNTAQTPAFGGSINVPYVTVNATGHITAASNTSVTIPATNLSEAQGGTDLTLVTTGDKYNWNHTTGGASALTDLTDTNITNVSDGQTLVYDSSSSKWINDTPPSGVTTLAALSDVTVSSMSDGQVLTYDNTTSKWINSNPSAGALGDLTNVTLTSPTDGQTLIYDNGTWINGAGGGGSSTLAGLSDVTITSPAGGEFLKYSGSNWVNAAPWTDITGTLVAGSTTVTFTSSVITTSSTVDWYVDDAFYGVYPTAIALATGSVTLTFESQASNIPVKVRIS